MLGVEIVQWLSPDAQTAEARIAELWMQGFRPKSSGLGQVNEDGVWSNMTIMVLDPNEREERLR